MKEKETLPQIKSDHCPIFLKTHPSLDSRGIRPFRCESIWLKQKDFLSISSNIWRAASSSTEALDQLQVKALQWNRESFGNIFYRKNRILKRIEGTQRALSLHPNSFLVNLDNDLNRDLNEILFLEEEFWASKSRVSWLNLGDANTTFFHASVISRRRHNKITSIKDNLGNWVYDFSAVRSLFIIHFQNLFNNIPVSNFPTGISCKTIPTGSLSDAVPSDQEIKEALWDLKPNKAPGVDGFQPAYYQTCWDSIKHLVCSDIQACFSDESVPTSWKKSVICLIPKVSNPSEIHHYRPISLCSTLYKIIIKILVNRMKHLLPSIISFNQGAFVSGRKPADNILIAQEVINSFAKKKGNSNGWMMIKLDLEKAYDKLNWEFICNTLSHFHFPPKWVNLVKHCISSVQHSVIFNGSLSDFLSPKRGIRQGDPISPYLFILCMEMLTSLINEKVNNNKWSAVKFKDISISHLLYADDVLLFAKINKKSVKNIHEVLTSFMNISGLNINSSKYYIWYSPKHFK